MFGEHKRKNVRTRGEGPMPVSFNEQVQLKTLTSSGAEDPDLAATRSLLSLAAASNESPEESNFATNNAFANAEGDSLPNNAATEMDRSDTSLWGLAMEYASGIALRTNVLEPTLRDFPTASQSETTRLLGMNCRGESLFVIGKDASVQQASMERIRGEDGALLTKWWEDDRFLSFTDQAWSDWWIRRCHLFDPGCEMYKLVTCNKETLGVVLYERNIVDNHKFGDNGRITLIRGIRVAPSLNPQVTKRKNLASDGANDDDAAYTRITDLLFSHVLYMSVRYGSNAVGVNCPKTLEAERFYESLMGPPLAFDESGRRYYRLGSEGRWKALRESFHQQVELWLEQLNNTPKGRPKRDS